MKGTAPAGLDERNGATEPGIVRAPMRSHRGRAPPACPSIRPPACVSSICLSRQGHRLPDPPLLPPELLPPPRPPPPPPPLRFHNSSSAVSIRPTTSDRRCDAGSGSRCCKLASNAPALAPAAGFGAAIAPPMRLGANVAAATTKSLTFITALRWYVKDPSDG